MYCKDICFLIVRKQDKSDLLKKQEQRLLMKNYQLEHGILAVQTSVNNLRL